eukprot:GHVT01100829.1.p1 GENE.GHVT01100829.1~~GHVT01100829.1.p1  ORF type:complete len:318 (+),score=56.86 GHVT01100829.1:355-1308(+)
MAENNDWGAVKAPAEDWGTAKPVEDWGAAKTFGDDYGGTEKKQDWGSASGDWGVGAGGDYGRASGRGGRSPNTGEDDWGTGFDGNRDSGRGRGRGGRGRGRDYDRHSGTGRGRELKKGGAGGHNWGNEDEEWTVNPEGKKPNAGSEGETSPKVGETLEGEEGEKEAVPEEEKEPEMIDLETYKAMMAAKATDLPLFVKSKPGAKITTEKDLTSQGYILHVKEKDADETSSEEESDEEGEDDDEDSPRKKKLNVYEYIHNQGGRVRLFNRPRGGRGGRGGRGAAESSPQIRGRGGRAMTPSQRDAPDIRDERAFPSLG